jgi:hypothetical protein
MDTTCSTCGEPVGELEVFPGRRCLKCHAAIVDKIPLSQLAPPDFLGALGLSKRRPRGKR